MKNARWKAQKTPDPSNENRPVGRALPPIIAFAPNFWHLQWMNRQHLLSRLAARGWPVVYSTGCLTVWDRGSLQWEMAGLWGRTEKTDGIAVAHLGKCLLRWPKFAKWDRFVMKNHANSLAKAAGPNWRDNGILFLFHPAYFPYVEFLKPRFLVFHVYDKYLEMNPSSQSDLEKMFIDSIESADLLTTASDALKESLPGSGSAKARVLYNGADSKSFRIERREVPCPEDLQRIPQPRIGNIGTINKKMDLNIIFDVARSRPEWHWVMVGEVKDDLLDTESSALLRACRTLPNVHFLGQKPRWLVPHYVCHMDVTTICYKVHPGNWVSAGYPLKLNEYLAAGKPVVATGTDVIRSHFHSVVDIASTGSEWIAAIERALMDEGTANVEERRTVAMQNTWDNRVNSLESWFFEMIGPHDRVKVS